MFKVHLKCSNDRKQKLYIQTNVNTALTNNTHTNKQTHIHNDRVCKRSPKEAQTNTPEYSVTKSIFASHIYTLSHQILRIDGSQQFAVSVVYVFLILFICLLMNTSNSYSIHVMHRFVYAAVAFMVCSFCVSSIKKETMHRHTRCCCCCCCCYGRF